MSDCATTDCPVPQECDETACPNAAVPHSIGADCDEWADGFCHAGCQPDPHRDYQGDAPHGGMVWLEMGEVCGVYCPRYEEDQDYA